MKKILILLLLVSFNINISYSQAWLEPFQGRENVRFEEVQQYAKEYFKDKKYHLNKTEECIKKGYRLIHINEDELLLHFTEVGSKLYISYLTSSAMKMTHPFYMLALPVVVYGNQLIMVQTGPQIQMT